MTSKHTNGIHTHLDDDGAPWRLGIMAGAPEAITLPAAASAQPAPLVIAQRTEITFIESNVADLPTLLKGLAGGEVHVLDAGGDGLQQIAAILAGRTGIDALHIISHGTTAAVNFGALKLDGGNLGAHRAELAAIGGAMADGGDILLYGCDVGAGSGGAAFIDRLADATGADVAASTNLTGAAAQGGDWRLEIHSGQVETTAVVDPALAALYQQTLAVASASVNFDTTGRFANTGSPASAAGDVLYNVNGLGAYQLKIDGATQGAISYGAGYVSSDAYSIGETLLTFSFVNGQVFTPTSIKVSGFQNGTAAQNLIFKGYDTAGNQVGTPQTVTTSSSAATFVTASFSGLTNIAQLRVTADPGSQNGKMIYLSFDDFALTNIQPPGPAVTSITSSTANGSYKVGDTISIQVGFDAAVTVTGTPQLTLATGGAGRAINYVGGSTTNTLTFTYTVQAGDSSSDLDLFSTGALSLNGGSITQTSGGAAATLTLPTPGTAGSLGANKALVVDGVAPTVAITSNVSTLKAGETATITFTFSEDPGATFTWNGSSGDVVVTGGTLGAISGAGLTRTATFTPTASTNGGTASITVASGSYADTVGNGGGAGATPSLTFDTLAPSAPSTPALAGASDSGTSPSDGITNDTTPTFTGTAEAGATVRLYDTDGTTVLDTAIATGGNWTLTSSALAAGAHSVSVKATDAAGNTSAASATQTVTIMTAAPTVSITSNVASLKANETATITFTFSSDPGATFTWDGSSGDVVVSGGTLGAISGTGLTRTATFTPAAATDNVAASITVTAASYADVAGNGGAAGLTPTLNIDTIALAPTIAGANAASDSGGSSTDGISNDGTPTITGTAENGAAVRLYDSDGTTQVGSATADGAGNWSITASALTEGAHTLTAKQTDIAGNVSAASSAYTYRVDTIGPTAMALSATTVALAAATNGATVATASSTDASAVSYDFAVGNGTIDADNAKFSFSGSSLVAAQTLGAGSYHIYVRATDAAGNDAFQIFVIDVVDAPAVSSIVRAAAAPGTVAASATSVSYTVVFSQSVTGVGAGDFTLTASGTAAGTIQSVTGSGDTYTVTVNGISGDGTLRLDLNASGTGIQNGSSVAIVGGHTAGQTYTLDHTAPAAPGVPALSAGSDSGASSSDAITSDTTPTVTGTAEANATVNLFDGATQVGSVAADGSGNWSITSSALGVGSHTLTARATDAAGNVSAAGTALTVVIDTSAAAPAALALASASDSGTLGDGITNSATPTITGTAEANAAITLYDTDGVTVVGTATANGSGAWSTATATLGDGAHTLTAVQTDRAGNVSAASAGLSLTIDTLAPAAPGAPVLAVASDSGTAGDDITNVATPVLTGTALAGAVVRLYDTNGTTVLGTATADGAGNWSITSSTLTVGAHTLTAKQFDTAGNASAAGAALALTIEAAPPPTTPPATTIDGVAVVQTPVALPGGGLGTQTVIGIVGDNRAESSGNAGVADIPLVTGGGANLLLAQIAPGYGLTASSGASRPAGSSTEQLIQAILGVTPDHPSSDQSHLTGNGVAFLSQLAASTPLLVSTIVPVSGTTAPTGSLTLTGTSTDSQHTALVIDAGDLAPGSTLVLNAIDFAAVIGAVNVNGNTAGQILTGDAAGQQFTVSSASGGAVFAGGGADALVFNSPSAVAMAAAGSARASAAADTTTILHGGLGGDSAAFNGASANYTIELHQGYAIITAKAQPQQHALVINAESLKFADTTLNVDNPASLASITGLYQSVLGRQADHLGVEFWATAYDNGASMGKIAIGIIQSVESQALHPMVFNGDSAHDIELLYQGIFGRHSDAPGLAFWIDKMAGGMSLERVADLFTLSAEMDIHKIGVQNWDFEISS
ncbi:Ig-like domain-containing protein [Burkholderia sp. LMU1-1-1.1]|uniref:Ig-like domain-containing protein n=1 Tax=Burkholderia sp. LMU1-1-1.1 TaxID=3135266 RepID=UPI00342772A8